MLPLPPEAIAGPCDCGCGGELRSFLAVPALRGIVAHVRPEAIEVYVGVGDDAPKIVMTAREWRSLLGFVGAGYVRGGTQ